MITEQLIEDLDLPDYDRWAECIWDCDHWWDYLIEDFVTKCEELGVDIDTGDMEFDIYRSTCVSSGRVPYNGLFASKYYDELSGISPVLTQMLSDGMFDVSWNASRRGNYMDITIDGNWSEYEEFVSGLFAGTSVAELWEIEQHHFEDFESCVKQIIEGLHSDLLKKLTEAYEWDTSEERYKESLVEQIHEAVWMQQQSTTVLNKTTTTGE